MNDFWSHAFEGGTPQCGMLCAAAGVILAFMLIFMGFWSTLFVAVLAFLGWFAGGVKDKKEFCRRVANRFFPPKQ